MSANIEASLRLEIAQYQASLAKALGDITKLKEHARKEGASLGENLFRGVVAFAAGGTIIRLGQSALTTVTQMDRMTRAMETMEGSAAGAQARLAELRETARLPGVGFEQAVQGDIRLRSVGISADASKQAIEEFGNALALSGGSAADLDGVILALGQIASKGKVSAEEINQIAERVPQIRAVMKNVFGTADTEALQDMGISAEEFITRTIEGFGQLDRASAGLDESLSDIGQSIKAIVNEGAGPIVNELVPAFSDLATAVAENKEEFAALGETAAEVLKGIGSGLKSAGQAIGALFFSMNGSSESFQKEMNIIDPRLLEKARNAGLGDVANQVEAGKVTNRGAMAESALAQREADRQTPSPTAKPRKKKEAGEDIAEPGLVDKKAAAKALKDEQQAQADLMREQGQLAKAQLDDYLSILPPNLKLLEVQREILRVKDDIENLPMHELDKLRLQQELVRWNAAERDVKKDIADEAVRAADKKKQEQDTATGQAGAMAAFEAEMALIDAKLAKDKELTAELERQAEIHQIMNQLMNDAGLAADKALTRATDRVNKEDELKKLIEAEKEAPKDSRYDENGRRSDGRKKINARIEGDAEDARQRAEDRGNLTRDRTAAKRGQMGSLSREDTAIQNRLRDQVGAVPGVPTLDDQTRRNAANGSGLEAQAQNNAQQGASAQNNPQQQIAQQLLVLVTQIAESVK